MKKIVGVLFVALMLVGCSGSNEKTTTICKSALEGATAEVSVDAKGDEVTKMVQSYTSDISENEVSDEEFLKEMESVYAEVYDDVEGVTFEQEVKDGMYTIKITMDMTTVDFDDLAELGILDRADAKFVSLEETIKEQESAGLTCKEQ